MAEPAIKLKWKNTTLVSIRKAGSGSYGTVYECYDVNAPQTKYAVKQVRNQTGAQFTTEVNKQYKIAECLNHRAVIQVQDLITDKDYTYIIMEMCDKDLSQSIPNSLNDREILEFMIDVTSGLRYMHSMNIIHRDLKPENLLLKVGKIKITDFGVSKVGQMCSTNVGTPVYQAPEIGQENPYDGRCDSFSLGIILYEMCYRKKPFRTSGFNPLYEDKNKLKTQSIVLPVEPKINTLFSDIIKGTIVFDPERRMTIGDIYYKLQSEGGEILEASRIGNKAGQVDLQLPKGANGIRITNILSK